MKKGSLVVFKHSTVKGVVAARRFTPDDQVEFLVLFIGADGEKHQRWSTEAEIVELPAAPATEEVK